MHVAYASRQVAYPPPILEISSNTAVARATPAREPARATFVALRADDAVPVVVAERTTPERTTFDDDAARETFAALCDTLFAAARDETADTDETMLLRRTALRPVVALVFATFTIFDDAVRAVVVDGRAVAERDTVPFALAVVRAVAACSPPRADCATTLPPRGLGAWAAYRLAPQNVVAATIKYLTKREFFAVNFISLLLHYTIF